MKPNPAPVPEALPLEAVPHSIQAPEPSQAEVYAHHADPAPAMLVTQPTHQMAPVNQAPTPMALLTIAMNQGADLDRLERLMAMQERWEANEARKAFQSAMSAFKANPPELHKNKQVKFQTSKGTTEYKHATLDEVALQIGSAMAPHGLSFRWNVEQIQGGRIRVTCLLTHVQGHTEQVVMEGSPDDSGNKNNIQQVGSTVTYLQRYTLLAATGMAVKDQDNDGATLPSGTVAEDCVYLAKAATLGDLMGRFKEVYPKAAKDKAAQAALMKAKDDRKAELTAGGAK